MKKVSVIIANRNDTVMLAITVRSAMEALRPLGLPTCEVIVCDNSDLPVYKTLSSYLPVKYIEEGILKVYRQDFPCLFTARETAIENAEGEYILCLDSHMLCGHGMILDLYNFMENHKDDSTFAFAHAPISWLHHHASNAKHDRDMSSCELGDWGSAYNCFKPITWKGMPWMCRKSLWPAINGYGALSQHHISWGGGDMHIGIKPWLLGFKNWAVPTSPGIHIGPFPKQEEKSDGTLKLLGKPTPKYKYRLYNDSGNGPHALGFLVSCYVLGGEAMMERNRAVIVDKFSKYINVDAQWSHAIELGKDEKAWLDERKQLTFEQLLEQRPWQSK
ncbi:MAG: glycosyltransferase family 2 protein [Gammaproteobacteria bacterium]|uniref:Putative glycosyltransferase n=1 Tax=viral metagenome TaxID=1070528 RepID=A0A6H1ZL53_9ZZZZ|nr:glycosyltransferase family 2 protein [Gammaproteobacteria bacterium]